MYSGPTGSLVTGERMAGGGISEEDEEVEEKRGEKGSVRAAARKRFLRSC